MVLQRCLGAGSGGGRLPIPGDTAARGRSGLKTDISKANRKDGVEGEEERNRDAGEVWAELMSHW